MSGSQEKIPVRLRATGATDLERRLLEAAAREQPSREMSARMAHAIGISAPFLGPGDGGAAPDGSSTPGSGTAGAGAAAPKAAAGSGAVLPLASGAVLAVIAGVVVATRPSTTAAPPARVASPAASVAAPAQPLASAAVEVPAAVTTAAEPSASGPASAARRRAAAEPAALSEQIALVDAARVAVATGAGERALVLLRQYRDKYPAGSFRPEASVLQIEALMKVGRNVEARALAERFVAEHRGSPLADRAARAVRP